MTESPARMLVINEWLFHDLQGENGREKQVETFLFLQTLEHRRERLAFLKESQWAGKSWSLMGINDIRLKPLSRLLQRILRNSNKCRIVQPEDIEAAGVPEEAIDAAPEEDIYLIQTYYASNADLLVTTDAGLLEAFESRQDVEVIHRDSFLRDYLNS